MKPETADFLTIEAIDQEDREKSRHALFNLPFPPNPSEELLDDAQCYVMSYLEMVVDQDDWSDERIKFEIERSTKRLIEIRMLWKLAAHEQTKPEPPKPEKPEFELPGEIAHDETAITKLLMLAEGHLTRIHDTVDYLPYQNYDEQRLLRLLIAVPLLQDCGPDYRLSKASQELFTKLFDEIEAQRPGFVTSQKLPEAHAG